MNKYISLFLLTLLFGCSTFSPTASTFDSTLASQNASNFVTNSWSEALTTKVIYNGLIDNNYVLVEEIHLESRPRAVSVFSTDKSNTDLVTLLSNDQIANQLFAKNSTFTHSDTVISNATYSDIKSQQGQDYLTSMGYNASSRFLKRTTVFTRGFETLTVVDYVFPKKSP